MRSKEAIKAAQKRYAEKGVIKRTTITLHEVNDADILAHLKKKANMSGYIKDLVRRDMKKQG